MQFPRLQLTLIFILIFKYQSEKLCSNSIFKKAVTFPTLLPNDHTNHVEELQLDLSGVLLPKCFPSRIWTKNLIGNKKIEVNFTDDYKNSQVKSNLSLIIPLKNFYDSRWPSPKNVYVRIQDQLILLCPLNYSQFIEFPNKMSKRENEFSLDESKGLLSIKEVTQENSGLYYCSGRENFNVTVLNKLKIDIYPYYMGREENSQAFSIQMICSSDRKSGLFPVWMKKHNQVTNLNYLDNSTEYLVSSVIVSSDEDLESYQCIIFNEQKGIWDSAQPKRSQLHILPSLAMTENDYKNGIDRSKRGTKNYFDNSIPLSKNNLNPPRIDKIHHNLALMLRWKDNSHIISKVQIEYQITNYQKGPSWLPAISGESQKADKIPKRLPKWHDIKNNQLFVYFHQNDSWLAPGFSYQMRIAVGGSSGKVSEWSNEVSFANILNVKPVITSSERKINGDIILEWSMPLSLELVRKNLKYYMILCREQNKTLPHSAKETMVKSDINKYTLDNKDPRRSYEIVVYALNQKYITRFSDVSFIKPAKRSYFTLVTSNQLMFLIFGILLSFMFIFIAICCIVIACRGRIKAQQNSMNKITSLTPCQRFCLYGCCSCRKNREETSEGQLKRQQFNSSLPMKNSQRKHFLLSNVNFPIDKELPITQNEMNHSMLSNCSLLGQNYNQSNSLMAPPPPMSPAPPPPPPFESGNVYFPHHGNLQPTNLYRQFLKYSSPSDYNSINNRTGPQFNHFGNGSSNQICNLPYPQENQGMFHNNIASINDVYASQNGRVHSLCLPNMSSHNFYMAKSPVSPQMMLTQEQNYSYQFNDTSFLHPSQQHNGNISASQSVHVLSNPISSSNNVVYVGANALGQSNHFVKQQTPVVNDSLMHRSAYETRFHDISFHETPYHQTLGLKTNHLNASHQNMSLSPAIHRQHQYQINNDTPMEAFYNQRQVDNTESFLDDGSLYNYRSGLIASSSPRKVQRPRRSSRSFNTHCQSGNSSLTSSIQEERPSASEANLMKFGNHNPTTMLRDSNLALRTGSEENLANSLTRKASMNLLGEPPKIRDYSEYGIPSVKKEKSNNETFSRDNSEDNTIVKELNSQELNKNN